MWARRVVLTTKLAIVSSRDKLFFLSTEKWLLHFIRHAENEPVTLSHCFYLVRLPVWPGVNMKKNTNTLYGARQILHGWNIFSRAMMYSLISKFAIISPKKQVLTIRNIEADSDSDRGENHTCTRLQKVQ